MFTTPQLALDETDDVLFKHDSTRWIYNEPIRQAERYLKFNVKELKAAAASSIGRSEEDVASISKLAEGGFNRTFTIAMQDGLELIARLPYPITVPKRYATASEVATIQFAELHGFPVPKIHDYSTTPANPVGAEYIIMEKVSGKPLRTCWQSLTGDDKCKIIDQLVQVEAALFSIELPATGSIYHKDDLDPETATVAIPGMPEDTNFCIGPSAAVSWWLDERANLALDRGPYLTPQDTMASVAKREMTWLTNCAQPRFPSEVLCRELFDNQKISPTPQIEALSNYLRICNHLIPRQANLNRFILRHPDLSPNNIFINDSLEVLGVIDWQHSYVLPVFLHVGIPNEIQNFNDDDSLALNMPRLPDDYSELGPEKKEAAREVLRRRELHFTYISCTGVLNPDHSAALGAPYGRLRKRLFHRAGTAWQGDNVSLKADLMRVSRLWRQITSSEDGDGSGSPFEFSATETKESFELEKKVQEAVNSVERVRDQIGMNEIGCVLPEHYDEIKERCRVLKAQSLEMAETDLEREEVLNHFPFDDHDESGNT